MLGWAITLGFVIAGLTVILKPVLTLLQKRYGRPQAIVSIPVPARSLLAL